LTETVVHNTILSGNTGSDVDFTSDSTNSLKSEGGNLIGTGNATTAFDQPGDRVEDTDPLLAPLGDYGGPTATMPPLAGSPAIDAAGTSDPGGTDQRGFSRFVNGKLDIGAVEAGQAITVTTDSDSGPGSLRQAIADAGTPGHRILFDQSLNGQTIHLTEGQLLIDKSLMIDASALLVGITVDANGEETGHRVMEIAPGHTVALHSLTLTGGKATGSFPDYRGGGIYNLGTLTLDRSTLSGNSARFGGGILNGGTLTLTQSTLSGNSADFDGGGITNFEMLTLTNSTLSGNSARFGGGIHNRGTLTLDRSTLSGNAAARFSGGGIYNEGTLTLTQSTLSGNSAVYGGGIFSFTSSITDTISSSTTLINCTLAGNTATDRGGAIYNSNGRTTLRHCTVSSNSAPPNFGGGVASYGDDFTETVVHNTILSGNTGSDVDFTSDTSDSTDSTNSLKSEGGNLIGTGNATTVFNQPGDRVEDTDPLLAPLGDYGGPTQTMPPLAGSPAIDAADTDDPGGTDQRGFPRFVGGALDIGAVEYQGRADLSRFWELDMDGDGKPYGLEFAIGTNPLVADAAAPGMLTSPTFTNPGEARMVFGVNPVAAADVIWRLKRSPDLSPGSFTEIFRFDGPSGMEHFVLNEIAATSDSTSITVLDKAPPEDRAFYILEVEPAAP
jgi:hypothetical protein